MTRLCLSRWQCANTFIFRGMQDCFRLHPEHYGSELQEDDVDEQLTEQIAQRDRDDRAQQQQQEPSSSSEGQTEKNMNLQDPAVSSLNDVEKHAETEEIRKANQQAQKAVQQEENLVPRAWHESEGEVQKNTEK